MKDAEQRYRLLRDKVLRMCRLHEEAKKLAYAGDIEAARDMGDHVRECIRDLRLLIGAFEAGEVDDSLKSAIKGVERQIKTGKWRDN